MILEYENFTSEKSMVLLEPYCVEIYLDPKEKCLIDLTDWIVASSNDGVKAQTLIIQFENGISIEDIYCCIRIYFRGEWHSFDSWYGSNDE